MGAREFSGGRVAEPCEACIGYGGRLDRRAVAARPNDWRVALDDQREVVSFLSDGAAYGMPGLGVERIETHISIIFLVGDRAFKLKRDVRFSYVDYSTTASRGEFCKA